MTKLSRKQLTSLNITFLFSVTCSHLKPCFPGRCGTSNNCDCQDGFRSHGSSERDVCLECKLIFQIIISCFCFCKDCTIATLNSLDAYVRIYDPSFNQIHNDINKKYMKISRQNTTFANLIRTTTFLQPNVILCIERFEKINEAVNTIYSFCILLD